MKLIFCPDCWDVVKLDFVVRTCKCGKIRGRYLEDGHHAEVEGGYVLGILNNSIIFAMAEQGEWKEGKRGPQVETFLFDRNYKRIKHTIPGEEPKK